MPLGPQTADLTRLSGLRVLHLVQLNTLQTPLLPPDLAQLPHLQLYQFLSQRSPIQVAESPSPGCALLAPLLRLHPASPPPPTHAHAQLPAAPVERVDFSRHGHGGSAALEADFHSFHVGQQPLRLDQLLHSLLPPGAELARLKASVV